MDTLVQREPWEMTFSLTRCEIGGYAWRKMEMPVKKENSHHVGMVAEANMVGRERMSLYAKA